MFIGRTDVEVETPIFGHLMRRTDSLEKTLIWGKIEGRRRRDYRDEIFGWHHQLDGPEFEQAPGVSDRQGSLVAHYLIVQLLKNPPAIQETLSGFLGRQDLLRVGIGYPPQYSGLENSMDSIVQGVANSRT